MAGGAVSAARWDVGAGLSKSGRALRDTHPFAVRLREDGASGYRAGVQKIEGPDVRVRSVAVEKRVLRSAQNDNKEGKERTRAAYWPSSYVLPAPTLIGSLARNGPGQVPSTSVDVEDDTLGEGKGLAVVDGVGGAAHVGLPSVGAGFAAASGLFFAAKGTADLGAGRADINVGDAAVGAVCGQEALRLGEVAG